MYTILLVIHSILVLFLIVMVLIQRSDSDGLSGLGGGGGNQFLTGRGTANLLTRTTAILAALFMVTSLVLAVMASRMSGSSIVDTVGEQVAPPTLRDLPESVPPAETPVAPAEPSVPKPE